MMALVGASILVLAVLVWLLRPRRNLSREPWESHDRIEPVDHSALEAAERDVQSRRAPAEDEQEGDEWGPGAA